MKIISQFMAPWAIAKEKLPFHLIWAPEIDFDLIEIELHPKLHIDEILNVKNRRIQDSTLRMSKVDLFAPGYFGLILQSNDIFSDLKKELPIKVVFLKDDEIIYDNSYVATIVRPKIEIVKQLKPITIDDRTNLKKLIKFQVDHKGLGKAKIDFTAKTEGKIISQSDSLYFNILSEIAQDMAHDNLHEEVAKPSADIILDSVKMYDDAISIIKRIKSGNFPNTIRKEILQELSEGIKDKDFRDKLVKIIYSKIQSMNISYMLYYFDRNPHEDIDLPVGKIKVNMESHVDKINLEIAYTDSYENQYDAVTMSVDINDQRTVRKSFQIPINIEWKNTPFVLGAAK